MLRFRFYQWATKVQAERRSRVRSTGTDAHDPDEGGARTAVPALESGSEPSSVDADLDVPGEKQ